jgi:hypothetical protein
VLAQSGDADVFMRGLALFGSAASVATALIAAWIVRCTAPDRPQSVLVAFGAVALLPVHLFVSPMPGNQMTSALLAAACLAAFVANETRSQPSWRGDAAVGVIAGLALWTRFSGLIPLCAVCGSLLVNAGLAAGPAGALWRAFRRAFVIAAVAFLIAAPYYQRNVVEFGNPFELSRGYPLVAAVEREQAPGARSWSDYLWITPEVFRNPDPRDPRMLHSVWGTVYANVWADIFRESDLERALHPPGFGGWMALAGLIPSALALLGAGWALRDLWRGRRRTVYVVMWCQTLLCLVAFASFSWIVPIWSALKSTYLLGLSVPWAVFLARGVEGLASRPRRTMHVLAALALAATGLAASAIAASGVLLPRRADSPASAAVYFYFGEYARARQIYSRLIAGSRYSVAWIDNLAAVELAEGRHDSARQLYARAIEMERSHGRENFYRDGQLAVATALAGDLERALDQLDGLSGLDEQDGRLSDPALPELRANRGAIRLALGDLSGAEADLRAALFARPRLVPAWLNLSTLLERAGRLGDARAAKTRGAREACAVPRGYPWGIGTGEVLEWGVGRRWNLQLGTDDTLSVWLPASHRNACRDLRSDR